MDKQAFLAEMARFGDSYDALAYSLGIPCDALRAKINGKDPCSFTQPELLAIKGRYSLTGEQTYAVFFGVNDVA